MAHHKKHEEHVNHERWLVSFADMMTLLFALFVVLYAMGVRDLKKVLELKNSIQFAFHIDGLGKTDDIGAFDDSKGAGDVPMPAPLLNAQNGPMRELLKEQLEEEFAEVAGQSLEIDMTNDAVTIKAPLSTFFEAGKSSALKTGVQNWLNKAVLGSLRFTSRVQVKIVAARELIGERNGRRFDNLSLVHERLITLFRVVTNLPEVREEMVTTAYKAPADTPAKPGGEAKAGLGWEERALVVIQFNSGKDD